MNTFRLILIIFSVVFMESNVQSQSGSIRNQQKAVNAVLNLSQSKFTKLFHIPIEAVSIETGFWKPRLNANETGSIPKLYELLVKHGVLDNFRRVSQNISVERKGYYFSDSDIYKWLEAASYSLIQNNNEAIRRLIDEAIEVIASAQQEDGYLNTWFVFERAKERFTKLDSHHELYCAGHLIQAGIAHK